MKTRNILFILAFLLCLVLPGTLALFLPSGSAGSDGEMDEKREKAEIRWNELFDSMDSINDWYNDRAPFRQAGISLYQEATGRDERFFAEKIISPVSSLLYRKRPAADPGNAPSASASTLPA